MKEPRIVRAAALAGLDDDECVAGYLHGSKGFGVPDGASYSFRHGWRNGMSDRGYRPIDEQQRQLVHDAIESGYFRHIFDIPRTTEREVAA